MASGILSPTHLLVVLVVALIVLGPKRLPGAGKAIGEGLREFKDSISGDSTPTLTQNTQQQPPPPVAQPVAVQVPVATPPPAAVAAPAVAEPAQAPAEHTPQG